MRRSRAIGAGAAAVVAVAVGAAVAVNAGDSGETRRDPDASTATAAVRRGDLSDSTSVEGTLGYGGDRGLKAGAAGVVTWIARPGSRAGAGDRLYELDGRPVRLMYGARPMYRNLKAGDEGPDVLQLEKNLGVLGYGQGLTVDRKYTGATAAAVERWQKDHRAKATGTVGPDAIVFAPGPVRVSDRNASVGDRVAPGGPIVTASGTERVVTLKLGVEQAGTLRKGTRVTVELPGGGTAEGAVRSVGTTASKDRGNGSDGDGDGAAKVKVVVGLADPGRVTGLDQAPVTVNITTRTRKDVLSVPVQALLALPGGGYGVRTVNGAGRRTVEVELGVFGEGRVEVAGDGLSEGVKVEVPSA
ncbi:MULTISPECIES: efflux RND transporter periplasmic adaptor subunit [Actinomadura]|uniref:Efflux RND transporter periplasmic adaptor subunit n=1 Tax=Actinomadura yumaensis TaxID=111807 RepID=A0ABW2CPD5_9ACTN|nr:peptidoglycan-binding protein [Actinomadura sp. J1-007]MWK36912.1 HlyD family efflux transporter periplasmic adaptor subunit [Actinomadura sp. J1-007]